MREEVLLWWDRPLQSEEGVVLHAGLPQVFAGSIVDHVETQQRLPRLCLYGGGEHGPVRSTQVSFHQHHHQSPLLFLLLRVYFVFAFKYVFIAFSKLTPPLRVVWGEAWSQFKLKVKRGWLLLAHACLPLSISAGVKDLVY